MQPKKYRLAVEQRKDDSLVKKTLGGTDFFLFKAARIDMEPFTVSHKESSKKHGKMIREKLIKKKPQDLKNEHSLNRSSTIDELYGRKVGRSEDYSIRKDKVFMSRTLDDRSSIIPLAEDHLFQNSKRKLENLQALAQLPKSTYQKSHSYNEKYKLSVNQKTTTSRVTPFTEVIYLQKSVETGKVTLPDVKTKNIYVDIPKQE